MVLLLDPHHEVVWLSRWRIILGGEIDLMFVCLFWLPHTIHESLLLCVAAGNGQS